MNDIKIKSALISVFSKEKLDLIVEKLNNLGVHIYSTGGTYAYIENLALPNLQLSTVESLTSYPSILGGRVKTLHPKVFGGILGRRDLESDKQDFEQYEIPEIDLVIVDLYPFEKTVASTEDEQAIIEKIDIGGISLIRAAAKNFKDVVIVPSFDQYETLFSLLEEKNGFTSIEDRKYFAAQAFNVSSNYDSAIFNYFNRSENISSLKVSETKSEILRYGENPHQEGKFYGNLNEVFEQLNGKAISYNNLNDIEAAIQLILEFEKPTFAILKHNNACGIAIRENLFDAWKDALAGDPISAFGGVLICNQTVDKKTAVEINKLFFEIILAPDYSKEALETLCSKKNRIVLKKKNYDFSKKQVKTILNGYLEQDKDLKSESVEDLNLVTKKAPTQQEEKDLVIANLLVKHTKSNAIVLVKDGQLIGSGTGQTSRVDALRHAIEKAKSFGFDLKGAVMASDAFFPFPDCVEIADNEGITAVVQPGGSIRDKDSIEYCDAHKISMVVTGIRHFKH